MKAEPAGVLACMWSWRRNGQGTQSCFPFTEEMVIWLLRREGHVVIQQPVHDGSSLNPARLVEARKP